MYAVSLAVWFWLPLALPTIAQPFKAGFAMPAKSKVP
jgi:hypothetical protein